MAKINISIPKPCHENWETMKTLDRGRFCALCQKNVMDFTKASDREIVTAFQKDNNLCGRFLNSQLNRDLVKPEKKNSVWLTTVTAFISLFSLNEALSQEKVPTEQTDLRALGKFIINEPKQEEIEVSGIIFDEKGLPLPGANIYLKNSNISVQADFNGKFTIKAAKGQQLIFSFIGYSDSFITVTSETKTVNVTLNNTNVVLEGMVIDNHKFKKRTFLGRIFHRIGNLFR